VFVRYHYYQRIIVVRANTMVGPSQVSDTWGSGVLKLCLFPTQRLRCLCADWYTEVAGLHAHAPVHRLFYMSEMLLFATNAMALLVSSFVLSLKWELRIPISIVSESRLESGNCANTIKCKHERK
jgi:hypothetical protein